MRISSKIIFVLAALAAAPAAVAAQTYDATADGRVIQEAGSMAQAAARPTARPSYIPDAEPTNTWVRNDGRVIQYSNVKVVDSKPSVHTGVSTY